MWNPQYALIQQTKYALDLWLILAILVRVICLNS